MPTRNYLDEEQSARGESRQEQSVFGWKGKLFEDLDKTLLPPFLKDTQPLLIEVIGDSSLDLTD